MTTIIAEKPSVALEIARIVGARTRKDGYMEGNGYAVTWALGHLVEIYAEGDDDWKAPLPLLPEEFKLRVCRTRRKDGKAAPDPGYAKQLFVIKYLFHRCDCIINAGDAGREGELIQRYIYEYVGGRVPVKRLWISSLTDEAIREGLKNLRPSSAFDNLYLAGKARSEADWLIGINATRALTKASGGNGLRSLGRVQTPTLALVCRRFIENRDFTAEPFWTIVADAVLGTVPFSARSGRYADHAKALSDRDVVERYGRLDVKRVEKKTVTQMPPLLHDLTSLQREANRRHGFSAQETLSAAQALYEKKLITYPRTGSRYITEDVFRTLPGLVRRLSMQIGRSLLGSLEGAALNRRSVNDAKVTDHHALLPTGVEPQGLGTAERAVYDLVLTRLFESVSGKCEMLETNVELDAAGVTFTLKGRTVLTPGWKAIRGEKDSGRDDEGNEILESMPPFHEGDACRIGKCSLSEGKTKPKPLYTDATLLEAMEHAGKDIEEEDLKEALKDCGLGTPATRAGEIETIIRRGYVVRNGKTLSPTPLGLSVYGAVKDKSIADVSLTANWEKALSDIADGRYNVKDFDGGIRALAEEIVSELMDNADLAQAISASTTVQGAKCPICGKAVMLTTRIARCVDDNCGWKIWRTVAGKDISDRDMASLLEKGSTRTIKGFRSKAGKLFDAALQLRGDGQIEFLFQQAKQRSKTS